MSTQKETTEEILSHLKPAGLFRVRAMFGEYALYANDSVVALICDDQLFVKILPETVSLEETFPKGVPYPGAKDYYLLTDDWYHMAGDLSEVLLVAAAAIAKKKK
ncbi:TfoX/Sxy family protein [soil metagenome]